MTRILLALLLGATGSALAWRGSRRLFDAPVFARRNVRGLDVPVGVGALGVLAALAASAVFALRDAATHRDPSHAITVFGPHQAAVLTAHLAERSATNLVLVTAMAFALLGMIDDLAGDHADKGFRGHLRALADGRLTTGSLKLVGGGVAALGFVVQVTDGIVQLLVGAALVALAANTANLFDRAPGRTAKVGIVAAVALVATASAADRPLLVGVAAVVGGIVGLVVPDLREQLMLGDAGANAFGATLGLGVVMSTAPTTRVIVLAVLVAVNLAGERVSFSAVIDRTPPLRALDRLGRKPL